MSILTQDATTAQLSSINFPSSCSACPHWQASDRTPNVGDCPIHELKTHGTDPLRKICKEVLAEIEPVNPKKACKAKKISHAGILVESIGIEEMECISPPLLHAEISPYLAQAIASQEEVIYQISLEISKLINLGARPGCVNEYPRPGRRRLGHNWVWTEDGVLKKKYIPLLQVKDYRAECDRGSKVRELKRLSSNLQQELELLRKIGGAS